MTTKLKTKITAVVTWETEEEIKDVARATEALGEHLQETVKEALPTLFDNPMKENISNLQAGCPDYRHTTGFCDNDEKPCEEQCQKTETTAFEEDPDTKHRIITRQEDI